LSEEPSAHRERELVRLIRRSSVMDPVLKRQWLRILPHLKPADLARLESILADEAVERRDGTS